MACSSSVWRMLSAKLGGGEAGGGEVDGGVFAGVEAGLDDVDEIAGEGSLLVEGVEPAAGRDRARYR